MKYTFVKRMKWCTDEGKNYHAHRWVEKEDDLRVEVKSIEISEAQHSSEIQSEYIPIQCLEIVIVIVYLVPSYKNKTKQVQTKASKHLNVFPAWKCAGL